MAYYASEIVESLRTDGREGEKVVMNPLIEPKRIETPSNGITQNGIPSVTTRAVSLTEIPPFTTFKFKTDTPAGLKLAQECQRARVAMNSGFKLPGHATKMEGKVETVSRLGLALHQYQESERIEDARNLLPDPIKEIIPEPKETKSIAKDDMPREKGTKGSRAFRNGSARLVVACCRDYDSDSKLRELERVIEDALNAVKDGTDRNILRTALVPGIAALRDIRKNPDIFFRCSNNWLHVLYSQLYAFKPTPKVQAVSVHELSRTAITKRSEIWTAATTLARSVCLHVYQSSKSAFLNANSAADERVLRIHKPIYLNAEKFLRGSGGAQIEAAIQAVCTNVLQTPPILDLRGQALKTYLATNSIHMEKTPRSAAVTIVRVLNFLVDNRLVEETGVKGHDGVARSRDHRASALNAHERKS
jgi:hypothetical protein